LNGLVALTITKKQDPYISRLARDEDSNLPHVYLKGEVYNFDSSSPDGVIEPQNFIDVESLAF